MVEYRFCIADTAVRFCLGPPKFISARICLARGYAPCFGGRKFLWRVYLSFLTPPSLRGKQPKIS